jgi:MYXO-CTERM domain-containing protein
MTDGSSVTISGTKVDVLFVGGATTEDSGPLDDIEVYDTSSGLFVTDGTINGTRFDHTATLHGNGTVLIAGGRGGNPIDTYNNGQVYVYNGDVASSTLTAVTDTMGAPRDAHTATLLPDGTVLIAGGYAPSGAAAQSGEIFTPNPSPALGLFVNAAGANMAESRGQHTATLLPNGRVVLIGGRSKRDDTGLVDFHGSVDIYDLANGGFQTGLGGVQMSIERAQHTATLLPGFRVLVAGGRGGVAGGDIWSTSEIFLGGGDTPSFGPETSFPTPRTGHAAIRVVQGGNVAGGLGAMISGGDNGSGGVSTARVLVANNGEPCKFDLECLSGHCADNVCCDEDCDEQCVSCAAALKESASGDGVCGPTKAGTPLPPFCIDDVTVLSACTGLDAPDAITQIGAKDCKPNTCNGTQTDCTKFCQANDDCTNGWCDFDPPSTGQGGAGGTGGGGGAGPNPNDLDGDGRDDATDDNCAPGQCAVALECANPLQEDNEGDGLGDVCDPDDDNDGKFDTSDNCPLVANPLQEDADGNGVGDACETGAIGVGGAGGVGGSGGAPGVGGMGGMGGSAPIGECQPLKDNSELCTEDDQCDSGFCVDGVCCDGPCTGQCQACNLGSKAGTCSNVGTPDAPVTPLGNRTPCEGQAGAGGAGGATSSGPNLCAGACDGSNGNACVVPAADTVVDVACSSFGATTTITTSTCDGDGNTTSTPDTDVCKGYPCADATSCTDSCTTNDDCAEDFLCIDSKCEELTGPTCDGDRTILVPGGADVVCEVYRCDGAICRTDCESVTDCVSGIHPITGEQENFVCNAEGRCVAPLEAPDVPSCGCRVVGGDRTPLDGRGLALALAAMGLVLARRRRRC